MFKGKRYSPWMILAWTLPCVLLAAMFYDVSGMHHPNSKGGALSQALKGAPPSPGASFSAADRDLRWDHFRQSYGPNLIPRWDAFDRLVELRVEGGNPKTSPVELGKIQVHALRIVLELEPLIRSANGSTWKARSPRSRTANAGAPSAEITLHQEVENVPLEPFGTVNLKFGRAGELRAASANVVSDLTISGDRLFGLAAARDVAEKQGEEAGSARFLGDSGRSLIWVDHAVPPSHGRRAYSFIVGGADVVVDAENGHVLSFTSVLE